MYKKKKHTHRGIKTKEVHANALKKENTSLKINDKV